MFKQRLIYEPIRTLAGNAIQHNAYTAVGNTTLQPGRILYIQNFSDVTCYFSTNSVDDMIYLPVNGSVMFDFTTNQTFSQGAFLPADTQFYVSGVSGAGANGAVYITVVSSPQIRY